MIDGRITVISGTKAQRQELQAALDQLEAEGDIWYGLFTSGESIISCYGNMNEKHIHILLDGSDGGYTRAATMHEKETGGAAAANG